MFYCIRAKTSNFKFKFKYSSDLQYATLNFPCVDDFVFLRVLISSSCQTNMQVMANLNLKRSTVFLYTLYSIELIVISTYMHEIDFLLVQ